jgi:aryl-alcohol dehydrogenase-like predicted oxidoreductase
VTAAGADLARLGVGLAAVGRPAYINTGSAAALPSDRSVPALRAQTAAVLDAAWAAGLRWVDVARSYGRAEEFLHDWLGTGEHPGLTVSSKWGYAYVGGWRRDAAVHEAKEHSLARFTAQLDETRALLAVDAYLVHSLTPDSPLLTDSPLQHALGELRDTGVRVGFSTSGPHQAETVERGLALAVDGVRLFDVVQSTWNAWEQSAGPALAAAHEDGVHVVVKEALANGRLVAELGDAAALAAVLAQPWADTVLLGAAGPEQLRSNLRCLDVTAPDVSGTAVDPGTYWSQRSELAWV